jgi:hypothetical protein
MGWACDTHGRGVLVGKPKGKRVLDRCRSRREDIIKIEFKETGWYAMD